MLRGAQITTHFKPNMEREKKLQHAKDDKHKSDFRFVKAANAKSEADYGNLGGELQCGVTQQTTMTSAPLDNDTRWQ